VTYQTYRDAASIAQFGPIEGTANVDTADVADPAAWAAKFLQDHAWPIAQASADGFELVKATGEAWDELDIGKTARLAVTRDGFPAVFPIETLRYEQLFGETPEKVRAELNRPLPRFSEALAKARETAQRAYGAGRSNTKALKENEHFQHMSKETKEGMEDCFGVIGVKLDPVTHEPLRDAQGNYIWAGPGDAAAEIWGHFHRTAWQTLIANVVKDGQGNVLSIGQVSTSADGKVFIDAINDQRTGTAKVRADRIKIDSTSGSSFSIDSDGAMTFNAENAIAAINAATAEINAEKIALNSAGTITLASKLGINASGLLRVDGGAEISGALFADSDLYVGNDLYIESGHTIQFSDGLDYVDYYPRDLRFGWGSNGFVKSVLSSSATEIAVGMEAAFDSSNVYTLSFKENTQHNYNTANLTHYHDITATEGTGSNAGKILFTLGAPRSTEGTTNFNIAATQFYINGVAAARDSIQAVLNGTSSKPTSGTSAGSATEGWYYQALTSYSGPESYTRKYGGYVYVPKYTVTKGSWSNGDITFTRETTTGTPSTSQSVSLSLSAVQMVSSDPNKWTVTAYDGNRNTGESVEVDATSRYEAGRTKGETDGAASVTLSQGTPSGGKVRVSASNGEYEDVDWRTANLISKITLDSSDTGTDVQKTANVRYNNGDSTTGVSVTVDASAVYAAGQAASTFDITKLTINLGNDYDATAQVPSKTTERQNNRVLVSGKIGVWYDGVYIGELRTFSISVGYGTPYINNPAAGYVRGAATINGDTITGNSIKLTESQISNWGGPIK